jgi:hypothetical protein
MNVTKSDIEYLCQDLEDYLNFNEIQKGNPATHKVHLNIYVEKSHECFVEIKVNGRTIFKTTFYLEKLIENDMNRIEGILLKTILMEVFRYGVMSSKQNMEIYKDAILNAK